MEGREHMIRNEINILKRISQGNKNILSLVDYFETVNNCKYLWRRVQKALQKTQSAIPQCTLWQI